MSQLLLSMMLGSGSSSKDEDVAFLIGNDGALVLYQGLTAILNGTVKSTYSANGEWDTAHDIVFHEKTKIAYVFVELFPSNVGRILAVSYGNQAGPVLVTSYENAIGGQYGRMSIDTTNDVLYAIDSNGALYAIDISNPTLMVTATKSTSLGVLRHLIVDPVKQELFVIGASDDTMTSLNVSNPAAIAVLDTFVNLTYFANPQALSFGPSSASVWALSRDNLVAVDKAPATDLTPTDGYALSATPGACIYYGDGQTYSYVGIFDSTTGRVSSINTADGTNITAGDTVDDTDLAYIKSLMPYPAGGVSGADVTILVAVSTTGYTEVNIANPLAIYKGIGRDDVDGRRQVGITINV